MQFVQVVKLVLTLLPLVLDALKAIEVAFPMGKQGAAKLAVLRATIEGAYGAAEAAVVPFEQVWPALEKAAGAAVALYNATGVFRK